MNDVLKYQKTIMFYDIKYLEILFNDAEMNRYFKTLQSRLIIHKKIFDILPDFMVEYECQKINKVIDINKKQSVIELLIAHKCTKDAKWHGNTSPYDKNKIVTEIAGKFNTLVDYKSRSTKYEYVKKHINGMYKKVKFDEEHQNLQLFAGF